MDDVRLIHGDCLDVLKVTLGDNATLYQGDCLEILRTLPEGSVDAVIADPPYGTTACKWDTVIPLESLWKELKRIIKPRGGIVMTASQPFTTTLISSNREWFKYCWVWDKVNRYTGFLDAARKPLKRHEDVVLFCEGQPIYNPQLSKGEPYRSVRTRKNGSPDVYAKFVDVLGVNNGDRKPCSIIACKGKNNSEQGFHPTQKPVALMSYLIRTYTNEGEIVLDFCFGSGTTGVACVQTGRKFIGIELDANYFAIAQKRIADAQNAHPLFAGLS